MRNFLRYWLPGIAALAFYAAAIYTASVPVAMPSVTSNVRITHGPWTGSGVYIGQGRILTAAHVIVDSQQPFVTVTNETGDTARAYVSWIDERRDVAMLRLMDDLPVSTAPYACHLPVVGTEIEAVGNPLAIYGFGHMWGRIASGLTTIRERPAIMVDMNQYPGMSGGAVYDAKTGEVVGLVSFGIERGILSLEFIVPIAPHCDRLSGDPVA